jgi:hypothetical protein
MGHPPRLHLWTDRGAIAVYRCEVLEGGAVWLRYRLQNG